MPSASRSRPANKRRPATMSVNAGTLSGWLLILLALPRLVRLLYPEVWVEDDFYLESAWLTSIGMRPYIDFVHPHLPLLEWVAAGYIKVVGASHFRIEVLNEAAIYLTSVLTFKLGARATGRRAAFCASILYAFSSLVFRYHVYERECFVAPLLLLALLAAIEDGPSRVRRVLSVAALLFAALAIKLTVAIPAAVLLGFAAIAKRRWLEVVETACILAIGLGAFCGILYWRYGFDFVFQVFLFHFMKGRDLSASAATYPLQILDVLAPLFVLGCGSTAASLRRDGSKGGAELWLVLAMAAAYYLFFGVISPTAWGHNYLEPLPFIAIVAGLGLERIVDAIGALVTSPSDPLPSRAGRQGRSSWLWALGAPIVIAVSLATVSPLVNENWLRESVYGFGYVPRAEVEKLADALDATSGSEDDVIAPSFICFQAHRRELIRYPETYGVFREGQAEFRRDGLARARAHLGNADFFALIEETAHFWSDPMREAIAKATASAVILDSPVQMLPLVGPPVGITPEFLSTHGYEPTLETEHFVVWKRHAK